nr:helix-turn-helix transcriptional regulator [Aestuariicella albida]
MFRTAIHQHEGKLRSSSSRQYDASIEKKTPGFPGHGLLQERLKAFGASLLTEREQEVVAQILKGKSSKLSARELKITPDTERSHRKRIYSKLGVTSQAELFSLVLNHLVYAE